ncbi:MAG TPA: O-antigen ligase family protein [Vicinamibacterales bacterium]|nr:O-antigen ligase family protein [Vicinamibacterales bacterium]
MATISAAPAVHPRDRLETAAFGGLLAFAAALQISIAAAGILLAFSLFCWAALVLRNQERPAVPDMFWPLLAYAAATLISCAFSVDPRTSFIASKELVLILVVPLVYELARGSRAMTVMTVVITVGAATAAFGIVQYGLLEYNNLGQRPQGTLSHYMTYSGLLLLVTCAAAARLLFEPRDRIWPALMMPALLAAIMLTLTRSAWVGTAAGLVLLLALKDVRLLALGPVAAALIVLAAPSHVASRFYSMFDPTDPTNRDRVAMLREGVAMVRTHPLTGVGPDMVERVYAIYRVPDAVEKVNPHLHNVPMQIAAERGLPALAIWIWFIVCATVSIVRVRRRSRYPSLPAAALAAVAGMLAAGQFEHNFGDSEFLMLFLVLLTLPLAAERPDHP